MSAGLVSNRSRRTRLRPPPLTRHLNSGSSSKAEEAAALIKHQGDVARNKVTAAPGGLPPTQTAVTLLNHGAQQESRWLFHNQIGDRNQKGGVGGWVADICWGHN